MTAARYARLASLCRRLRLRRLAARLDAKSRAVALLDTLIEQMRRVDAERAEFLVEIYKPEPEPEEPWRWN